MINATTVSMIRDIVAIFGVIAGFTYYVLTVRTNQKNQKLQLESRQLQLYTTTYEPGHSKEWLLSYIDVLYNQEWKDYDELMSKYGPETNPEGYTSLIQVIELFQMIGLYVAQDALDIDIVAKHNIKTAIRLWEKVEPYVKIVSL